MTIWLIGMLIVAGGIINSDDSDELKWYHWPMILILWPLILGVVLSDIHEFCKNNKKGGEKL